MQWGNSHDLPYSHEFTRALAGSKIDSPSQIPSTGRLGDRTDDSIFPVFYGRTRWKVLTKRWTRQVSKQAHKKTHLHEFNGRTLPSKDKHDQVMETWRQGQQHWQMAGNKLRKDEISTLRLIQVRADALVRSSDRMAIPAWVTIPTISVPFQSIKDRQAANNKRRPMEHSNRRSGSPSKSMIGTRNSRTVRPIKARVRKPALRPAAHQAEVLKVVAAGQIE